MFVCVSLHYYIHLAENGPVLPDSLIVASIRKSQELLIEIDSSVDSTYIKGYVYTKAVTSKWTFIICSIDMHTVFSVAFFVESQYVGEV